MAKITLPYTIQNGNTADGGQVQQDFDAILTQVNGNLDADNIASGAVTLAKLASDVKVIENIYHTEELGDYYTSGLALNVTDTETTILTLNVTLSSDRYLLFLSNISFGYFNNNGYVEVLVKDGTNTLWGCRAFSAYDGSSNNGPAEFACSFLKQYSAGSYTFSVTGRASPSGNSVSAYARSFTIIQFNF